MTTPDSAGFHAGFRAGLDRALAEPGRFVLVHAASGGGKTTVAGELAGGWGGPVARATGAEWEAGTPGSLLAQAFPGLRVHSDLLTTAAAVADRAVETLVVVDDAHLSDPDSLKVLSSALRHHPASGMRVLATATLDDPRVTAAVHELLGRLATDEFRVPRPSPAQISRLAGTFGVTLHPSMAEQLWRHTQGVPRPVTQLLREVPHTTWARFDPDLPAPASVAAFVAERLAACSTEVRAFAEAAAVLGADTPVRSIALLAALGGEPLEVLDAACASGLVAPAPGGVSGAGPASRMIRAAVLAALGPRRRAALHRTAAGLVADPARSLRLLAAASPVPDADVAARLEALATERAAEGEWATAASLLSDAGRVTDDPALQQARITRAVDALIGAGEVYRAAALAPEVESVRETPLREAVLAYLAVVRGRAAEAGSRLTRAWDIVNRTREPEVAALICQRRVLDSLARYDGESLVTWADRAVSLGGPAAIEAAAIRGLGAAAIGQSRPATREYDRLAHEIRHGPQAQRIVMARGWLNLLTDRIDDARVDLESAVPTAFLGGSARISLWAQAWLARTHFLAGDWDEALRVVDEAAPLLDRSGIRLIGPLLHWTAASVHALRGEPGPAEDALLRCDAGAQDYLIMQLPARLARAVVAETRADSAGVLRALHPLTRPNLPSGVDEPGHWPWHDAYAHALILTGRLDDADAFLAPHERLAEKREHVSARARLAAARGRLLGARGDPAGATAAFEEARELVATLPLRYDRARIDFAHGQTLRRLGRRARADTALTAAREGFAALGAAPYVAWCDRELKAGGVHTPRAGHGDLTPQEEAVVQLVSRGLSNREVAAELFLSVKTVQYHLTRVYGKLGIRSRTELAALRNTGGNTGGNTGA